MSKALFHNICMPTSDLDDVWEIFHENSKVGRYDYIAVNELVVRRMQEMCEALTYEEYPFFELDKNYTEPRLSLKQTIIRRITARDMKPCRLNLRDLSTLFYTAYGITRENSDNEFPRSFRTVPSGGALYPLELYFHTSTYTEELEAGIYHYNPKRNGFEFIIQEDQTDQIAKSLTPVQTNLAYNSSIMVFITALFQRSTFKYGPRGYRFAFLEAGHVAQNINLVSTAMGLGSVNICGYFDREIDELLGIDGLKHSTIYMIGIGKNSPE
jgi:SagB-type dehydrogenase family enzyme